MRTHYVDLWRHLNGRMFFRFMLTPRTQMDKELREQEKELSDEVVVLQKKVRGAIDIQRQTPTS